MPGRTPVRPGEFQKDGLAFLYGLSLCLCKVDQPAFLGHGSKGKPDNRQQGQRNTTM